jgi:hypothetical protein
MTGCPSDSPLKKGGGGVATVVAEPPGGCRANSGRLRLGAAQLISELPLVFQGPRDNPRAFGAALFSKGDFSMIGS